MSNNRITCRWHQLNYRPYRPSWLRKQLFLLCGEHWRDLVEMEMVTASPIFTNPGGFIWLNMGKVRVEYYGKDGEFYIEEATASSGHGDFGSDDYMLFFHKPIVEPMASKDVYLKVI